MHDLTPEHERATGRRCHEGAPGAPPLAPPPLSHTHTLGGRWIPTTAGVPHPTAAAGAAVQRRQRPLAAAAAAAAAQSWCLASPAARCWRWAAHAAWQAGLLGARSPWAPSQLLPQRRVGHCHLLGAAWHGQGGVGSLQPWRRQLTPALQLLRGRCCSAGWRTVQRSTGMGPAAAAPAPAHVSPRTAAAAACTNAASGGAREDAALAAALKAAFQRQDAAADAPAALGQPGPPRC
jgi:hypothetical protein